MRQHEPPNDPADDVAPRARSSPPPPEVERSYSQLFDLSPFPAVVSRLHDHTRRSPSTRARSEVIGMSAARCRRPVRSPTTTSIRPSGPSWRTELRRDGRADNLRAADQARERRAALGAGLVAARHVAGRAGRADRLPRHQRAARRRGVAQGERAPAGGAERCADRPDRRGTPIPSERFDERLRSILEISARGAERRAPEHVAVRRRARSRIRCVGPVSRSAGGQYESGAVLHRARRARVLRRRSSASA